MVELRERIARGDIGRVLQIEANFSQDKFLAMAPDNWRLSNEHAPFEGRFAVYGSRGWIEIRDRTHPENPTGWDVTTCLAGQERATVFMPPYASVRANLEAFATAVKSGPAYPVSRREMLANVAALEAIMRSTGTGQVEAIMQPAAT